MRKKTVNFEASGWCRAVCLMYKLMGLAEFLRWGVSVRRESLLEEL